ncbi:MAG: GNAT family N-acetyltransferase [Cyanobacteriota bacterium]|nr:GNAT family N-acetyltransferase [Cyanobacteriota bacterium]
MEIKLASLEHLEILSELFDRYRIFYNQKTNITAARNFLKERFQNRDSVIFIAYQSEKVIGFTQLYPSLSSVSMKRILILNDLFVIESYRRKGVATSLMDAAESYARDMGSARIALSTQVSNTSAQKLYRSRNYVKDELFYHYQLQL